MSTLYDTLEYNGTERSFAGWQLDYHSAVSRLGNAKPDTFNCRLAIADVSADPIFPYEAQIILRTNRASADGSDNSFSGGTVEFVGKRTSNVMRAVGNAQAVQFEFQGPWYDLSITQYLQQFKGATAGFHFAEVVLNTAAAPAISTSGLRFISMGDQLQSILQFVLDSYVTLGLPAPFQYIGRDLNAGAIDLNVSGIGVGVVNENTDVTGAPYTHLVNAGTTIDLDLFRQFLKSEIVRPMSAAETIQKLLDSSPRTVVAFDYTTVDGTGNPLPTIYIRNVDNLPGATLPLFDGTPDGGGNKSLNLQRRDDLVPTAVIIVYRITASVGGNQVVDYIVDKWGAHGSNNPLDPDAGPGVIIQILDLQGFNETFSTSSLDVEPLACIGGTHAQKRAWWALKRGGELANLENFRVRFQTPDPTDEEVVNATTIPDATILYATNDFANFRIADQPLSSSDLALFVNRHINGTVHSWMTVASVPVQSLKVKVQSAMEYAEYDCEGSGATPELDETGTVIKQHNEALQHCNLDLTNGTSGPYSTVASSTPGESYIIGAGGIGQYLFTMLSTLQYEGEYAKVKAAFDGGVSLLNRANFSGGRAEWTTIKAQIQDIVKDWGSKQTEVRIGVSKHLNAGQLSAFLNMWRFRRTWYNPAVKGDNTIASNGEVSMPKAIGSANTVPGLQTPQQEKQVTWTTPPTGITPGVPSAQINHDPNKINAILAATTPTPVAPFVADDLSTLQPREIQLCDEAGNLVNAILHMTGVYTKP